MDSGRPSLARRALAVLVLLVVAVLAIRIVVGFVAAIFWMVALGVMVIGALWAVHTLRASRRGRERRVRERSPRALAAPSYEDRVAAELQAIQKQLRERDRG